MDFYLPSIDIFVIILNLEYMLVHKQFFFNSGAGEAFMSVMWFLQTKDTTKDDIHKDIDVPICVFDVLYTQSQPDVILVGLP